MSLQIFILAAGKGTRMRSDKPKVLHEIGGQAMLRRVYNTACGLRPACIHIVYGFGGDQIRASMSDLKNVDWVYQAEQLGTGHAVRQAAGLGTPPPVSASASQHTAQQTSAGITIT